MLADRGRLLPQNCAGAGWEDHRNDVGDGQRRAACAPGQPGSAGAEGHAEQLTRAGEHARFRLVKYFTGRTLSQNQLNRARVLNVMNEIIDYPGRAIGCERIVKQK